VEDESIDEDFENLNSLYDTCKMKGVSELYMQYSLRAIREIIEQPIGSPKLKYKEMSLEKKLETANFRQCVLLTNGDSDDMVIFMPVLEEQQLEHYLQRVKAFVVLKPGYTGDQEMKNKINDVLSMHVAKYALPREIEFRSDLPKTLVGKVAYRKLEEEANAEAAKMEGNAA
jgi:acyl-CoA synthetase (AMP-forming)/AMP-acid ligase II